MVNSMSMFLFSMSIFQGVISITVYPCLMYIHGNYYVHVFCYRWDGQKEVKHNGHVCPQHMYYKPDIWIGKILRIQNFLTYGQGKKIEAYLLASEENL